MIGAEARLTATLNAGTVNQQTTSYGATNQVIYFSVDGSPVTPRRTVVAMANCNACHAYLEVHGDLRNNVTYCVICHNPENTDFTTRPSSTDPVQKAAPNQAINFALMVHKIHTGANLASFNSTYIVVGHGGSLSNFDNVLFPPMGPDGGHARHRPMLHVPRQQLRGGLPHRLEPGHRSARAVESSAGYHFGLHRLPLEHLRHGARGLPNRSEIRRELRCLPRRGYGLRRVAGARRQVE